MHSAVPMTCGGCGRKITKYRVLPDAGAQAKSISFPRVSLHKVSKVFKGGISESRFCFFEATSRKRTSPTRPGVGVEISADFADLPPAVEGAAAWYGPDLMSEPTVWTRHFSESEIQELEEAVQQCADRDLVSLSRDDFPLPTLGPILREIAEQILNGRGFMLLKGLPVWKWSTAESATAYYGLGTWIGCAVSQNAKGHVLGHVKDIGGDKNDPKTRIYTTNAAQPYHVDSCDVVGLLCLKPAMSGGHSNVTSSATVYNEVLQLRPDLAKVLTEDMILDRKGEVPEGKDPWFSMPLFIQHEGRLVSWYDRSFISAAQARFPDLPRLTPLQEEALDFVDALASDPRLRMDMSLEPGDIQLLHNHQIWHARTAYEDYPDEQEDRKRHLMRLWLAALDGWELPPQFEDRYGDITLGTARGGIKVAGTKLNAPLEAS